MVYCIEGAMGYLPERRNGKAMHNGQEAAIAGTENGLFGLFL